MNGERWLLPGHNVVSLSAHNEVTDACGSIYHHGANHQVLKFAPRGE
jgi:hypothetical protein